MTLTSRANVALLRRPAELLECVEVLFRRFLERRFVDGKAFCPVLSRDVCRVVSLDFV
jgi:hypothetical protein